MIEDAKMWLSVLVICPGCLPALCPMHAGICSVHVALDSLPKKTIPCTVCFLAQCVRNKLIAYSVLNAPKIYFDLCVLAGVAMWRKRRSYTLL